MITIVGIYVELKAIYLVFEALAIQYDIQLKYQLL